MSTSVLFLSLACGNNHERIQGRGALPNSLPLFSLLPRKISNSNYTFRIGTKFQIFRRTRCPVLSVGPKVSHKPDREAEFHHILFATDFSPESLAALPYAISLAEEDEAHLALLHVVGQPAAGIVDLKAVTAHSELRLKQLIPPHTEPWCHAECLVEFGSQFASPAERISKVAENSATDLVVHGVCSVRGKLGLVTHLASTDHPNPSARRVFPCSPYVVDA